LRGGLVSTRHALASRRRRQTIQGKAWQRTVTTPGNRCPTLAVEPPLNVTVTQRRLSGLSAGCCARRALDICAGDGNALSRRMRIDKLAFASDCSRLTRVFKKVFKKGSGTFALTARKVL